MPRVTEAMVLAIAAWGGLGCLHVRAGDAQEITEPRIARVEIGFDGHYKAGCFTPVVVTVMGTQQPLTLGVQLELPDGDGVPARVSTPPDRLLFVPAGQTGRALLYAKPGRGDGALTVRLHADGREVLKQTFFPDTVPDERHIPYPMASTDQLVLVVGPRAGLEQALEATAAAEHRNAHVAYVDDCQSLPTRWYGLEGVDTLVLLASRSDAFHALGSDNARAAAVREWLGLGGQLAIFVASQANQLLGPAGPLASLVPGTLQRMAGLRQTRELESYSETTSPIALEDGASLPVPVLTDVEGNVEAFEGGRDERLPLVVRAPREFGEVVVALVDVDQPPIRAWPGRPQLLRKVLGKARPPQLAEESSQVGQMSTFGYVELTGQLRAALDQFDDVQVVSFWVVAMLVLVYVAVIGPLDYLLVRRVLKRMEFTWITFPVWVALFSLLAYGLTYWLKGSEIRVNQVEIVDVDLASGRLRGTHWSHLFTPRARRYDVSLALRPHDDAIQIDNPQLLFSWMGVPGSGLGGMEGGGASPWFSSPYDFSYRLDQLLQVPVQVWSTKSFSARWSARCKAALECQLSEAADRTVSGRIVNRSSVELLAGHLLYDRWVYPVPKIPPGSEQLIGDALQPRFITTWLGATPYTHQSLNVPVILNRMMFREAAGGSESTTLPSRYQQFCDLSRHLQMGRAVLLVQAQEPTGRLSLDGQVDSGPGQRRWLVRRYVIPVERSSRGQSLRTQ